MIELFVNGHECVLPSNYSFTFIEENPEITNNGEFSLDISLSLLNRKNAIAFGFLNRINLSEIKDSATAKMVDDGKVRNGTIHILSNSDDEVKFKFISGNSELNYIAKTDKKIWEFDWGTENEITYSLAKRSIDYAGYGHKQIVQPPFNWVVEWDNNYVCAPIEVNKDGNATIFNNFKFIENVNVENRDSNVTSVDNILMQPYLLYYINRLPALLGYTIKNNCLNTDNRAKIMYLINTVDTLNYADFLPDITVSEFIDAIEKFFNVSFLVNSTTKSISIIDTKTNTATKKIVTVDNILDSYNRELKDSEENIKPEFSKIKYDLRDSTYFKYQELDEEILKSVTHVNLTAESEIFTYISSHGLYAVHNVLYLFNISSTGNSYFYGYTTLNLYRLNVGNGTSRPCLINKFNSWGSGDNVLTLQIIPAEIKVREIRLHFSNLNNNDVFLTCQMPVSSGNYYVKGSQSIVEMIEGTVKNVPRSSVMEVALFTGIVKTVNSDNFFTYAFYYPFSHCDYYPEFGPIYNHTTKFNELEAWRTNYYAPVAVKSMRLNGVNGIIADYHQEKIIDSTREYTFIFEDKPDVMASNLFMIKNQKYMPISFERKKTNKKTPVIGKFYRML